MEILIYIVLAVGAVVGFCQGLLKQAALLIGVGAGLLIAAAVYEPCGDWLAGVADVGVVLARGVAFVVIAVTAPFVCGLLASLLTRILKKLKLNILNRIAGAVVGMAGYGILLAILFNLADFFMSDAGFSTDKLDERPALFYIVKQAVQPVLPDALIVTDKTEVAQGREPRYGCKQIVTHTDL